MIVNSFDKLPAYESKSIIDMINSYLIQGNELTEGISKIVDAIISQGYSVTKDEDGIYHWPKKISK